MPAFVLPAVDQIEHHPAFTQRDSRSFGAEQMASVDAIDRDQRVGSNPDGATF